MGILEITYTILVKLGGLFLILSIFCGADHDLHLDIGHADFDVSNANVSVDNVSVVSIRFLATFALSFGIGALIALHSNGGTLYQLVAGFISGLLVTAFYYFIMKIMYSMQGNSSVQSFSLIGKTGIIITGTTEKGLNQVRVATSNGNSEYICHELTGKKLKQNDIVTIVKSEGVILIVEKT